MTDKRQATIGHEYPCFAGDGEAARMMRATDWAATPLGPVEGWPPGLGSIVATLLGSRQPMFLWWGRELVQFYNDAYIPSLGQGKHPAAMGQRGRDCWPEIWPIIGSQIDDVTGNFCSSSPSSWAVAWPKPKAAARAAWPMPSVTT